VRTRGTFTRGECHTGRVFHEFDKFSLLILRELVDERNVRVFTFFVRAALSLDHEEMAASFFIGASRLDLSKDRAKRKFLGSTRDFAIKD
jgi:hypothetical protein